MDNKSDTRLEQLNDWLHSIDINNYEIAPASADASFRRYFRIRTGGLSRIVMDAPPEHEDSVPFVKVSALMHELGLNVPVVLAQDLQQGFLLLSDLGDRMYLPELNENTVEGLYAQAIDVLVTLQQCKHAELPAYGATLLMNEMGLFRDWYLARHLGIELNQEQADVLETTFQLLKQSALSQPQVVVHRDYHSRNLMLGDAQSGPSETGILDFQDAVIGPLSYDLVSLLRDCYIEWPRQQVRGWVSAYYDKAQKAGIISDISIETFIRWFDWMGIQRHLKASGIFARLNHRDGKPGYLNDIPRTLGYIIEVAANYPELQPFMSLLDETGVIRTIKAQNVKNGNVNTRNANNSNENTGNEQTGKQSA